MTEKQLSDVIKNHEDQIQSLLKNLKETSNKVDKAEIYRGLASVYARLANDHYAVKNVDGEYELTTDFRVVNKK